MLAIAGPHVTEQAGRFADELPTLLQDKNIADRLPLPAWLSPYAGRLIQLLRDHLADGGGAAAAPVAKGVGRFVLAAGGGLVLVVLLPILAFLMLVSGPSLRERFLAWTRPHRHGGMWRHIVSDLDVLLGGYIRALVILAIATTLSYSIALSLFGLPYSLLLAASGGALEFVPVLGPLTAALSIVGVAVLGGYGDVLWIAAFIAAYRVFQDYILNPFLMNKSVAVPALLVLFGLLAGEELAGVAGVFLATPLLAAALILVRRVSQEQAGGETAIQTSD